MAKLSLADHMNLQIGVIDPTLLESLYEPLAFVHFVPKDKQFRVVEDQRVGHPPVPT